MLTGTEIAVLAAPLLAWAVYRSGWRAFLASYPVGLWLLWRTMIANEAAAPDSDFDIVFHIAIHLFSALLGLYYIGLLLAAVWGLSIAYRRAVALAVRGRSGASG